MTVTVREHARGFVLYAYAVFVLAGVMTTMIGPLLPFLIAKWRLEQPAAGTLFISQFGASTVGTLCAAVWIARLDIRRTVSIGLLFCFTGAAGLLFLPWPWLSAAVAIYGIGLGICIPVLNLAVAKTQSAGDFRRVALLNSCWTVGAVVGPLVLRILEVNAFLVTVAIAATSLAVGSMYVGNPIAQQQLPVLMTARVRHAALFAVLFFAYVGSENAVSGWLAVYSLPFLGDVYRASLPVAVFWCALLVGRLLSSILRSHPGNSALIVAASLTAIGGILILGRATSLRTFIAGIVACGVGLAPIYPVLISRMGQTLGERTSAATLCFAFSGFGAATVPFLSALVSHQTSNLHAGLLLPAALLLLMIPLQAATIQRTPSA